MKQPNLFVKLAVIASSVLLVSGLVAYRAGAFSWLMADKPTTMGGSKSKALIEPAPPETQPAETTPTVDLSLPIMSGSKSGILIVPPSPTPDTKPPLPTIMPGSKASFAPVISPPAKPQAPPPSK
jgi:hypothetical protein